MKLRTKLRLALVAVVIVLISMPYAVGRMAERRYRQFTVVLNAQYGNAFTLERYDRGMFTSTAETRVDLSTLARHLFPAAPPESFDALECAMLRVRSVLRHGLLPIPPREAPWGFRFAVAVSDDTLELVLPRKITATPITLHAATLLHFDGSLETRATLPAQRIPGAAVAVSLERDCVAHVRCDAAMTPFAGTVNVPAMEIIGEKTRVELAGFRSSFERAPTTPLRLPLRTSFSFDWLTVSGREKAETVFSNCTLVSAAHASNALMYGTVHTRCERIEIGSNTLGPLDIRLATHNLDVHALQRLQTLLEDAERNTAEGTNPTALIGLAMTSLPNILNQLLRANPRLVIEHATLVTPHGTFALHGTLAAKGTQKLHAFSFLTPQDFLKIFAVDVEMTTPKSFVDEQIIGKGEELPLPPSTLFTASNDTYLTRVTLSEGQLFVNGMAVPLSSFRD